MKAPIIFITAIFGILMFTPLCFSVYSDFTYYKELKDGEGKMKIDYDNNTRIIDSTIIAINGMEINM